MPVERRYSSARRATRRGSFAYGSRVSGSRISQTSESVGASVAGSRIAVSACGRSSMSDSEMPCQPRIEEPSKPRPSVNADSSSARTGSVMCCHVPSRSQNFRSTIAALVSPAQSIASRGAGAVVVAVREVVPDSSSTSPSPSCLDHEKEPQNSSSSEAPLPRRGPSQRPTPALTVAGLGRRSASARCPVAAPTGQGGAARSAAVEPGARRARRQIALIATILGSGIALLDATIVNVALPAIEEDLGGGLAGQQWVVERLPADARLADPDRRLARRHLRRAAHLLARRRRLRRRVAALRGRADDRDARRRPRAAGRRERAAHAGLARGDRARRSTTRASAARRSAPGRPGAASRPSLGPLAGGWIVDVASWRWIFAVNVPFVLVTLVLIRISRAARGEPAAAGTPGRLRRRRALRARARRPGLRADRAADPRLEPTRSSSCRTRRRRAPARAVRRLRVARAATRCCRCGSSAPELQRREPRDAARLRGALGALLLPRRSSCSRSPAGRALESGLAGAAGDADHVHALAALRRARRPLRARGSSWAPARSSPPSACCCSPALDEDVDYLDGRAPGDAPLRARPRDHRRAADRDGDGGRGPAATAASRRASTTPSRASPGLLGIAVVGVAVAGRSGAELDVDGFRVGMVVTAALLAGGGLRRPRRDPTGLARNDRVLDGRAPLLSSPAALLVFG